MRYLAFLAVLFVVGCSSTTKILVKNCKQQGSGSSYYECEEISKKEVNGRT